MALPIHLVKHFCCRMYRSVTKRSKKQNRQNFRIGPSHGQPGPMTMAIPDATFSVVRQTYHYMIYVTTYDSKSEPSTSLTYSGVGVKKVTAD